MNASDHASSARFADRLKSAAQRADFARRRGGLHVRLACLQLALLLTLLASGCCCLPQLSGRYEQCPPAATASSSNAANPRACDKLRDGLLAHHGEHRQHGRRHWPWGHPDEPGTPPGELVPLPKFHPVPVRPVFEPQYDYSQAQFLGPMPNYGHLPQASSGEPTPAKPIPDPQ